MAKTQQSSRLKFIDTVPQPLPVPIPGMSRYARAVWKRTVKAHPPEQFKPGTLEILRAYCEVCFDYKTALKEIRKDGAIITQSNGVKKRNPWCLERDACLATMISLATKLQLNVNSKIQAGIPLKKKSKFDNLLFGGRDI